MELKLYSGVVKEKWKDGAILNTSFSGFKEDYLALHCLIKKYKPTTFFEIGTSAGIGTKIIKNALPEKSKLYSLDLPDELIEMENPVGYKCNLKYTQLRGDSLTFDFSQYPCQGYFIDGAHTFGHVFHETTEILKLNPRLIIWHDANISCVEEAINKAMHGTNYDAFRVIKTRIAFAIKKQV